MLRRIAALVLASLLLAAAGACEKKVESRAAFIPLAALAPAFGVMVSAGNHPTPDQHGTGERLALFRAADGTVWGLPASRGNAGEVLVCASEALLEAPVTDVVPRAAGEVIGSTNEPTGWRGGTGRLELVLRNGDRSIHWQSVRSREMPPGVECWASEPPGPKQRLRYYRLQR